MFVRPDSDKQDPGTTIGQIFFSRNGRRGGLGGVPNAQVPTSPNCVRTGPSWAKLPERLTVKLRGSTAVQQLLFDRLFTWPLDQPRHATKHFRSPVDARSPPVCQNYTLDAQGKKLGPRFDGDSRHERRSGGRIPPAKPITSVPGRTRPSPSIHGYIRPPSPGTLARAADRTIPSSDRVFATPGRSRPSA